jgi:GDP/UDP-N,N'-diacetylbacillosamine 2-epimerase (hydrolysing)
MDLMIEKELFVITSSRSDFGILKKLIFSLQKFNQFQTRLIVTGSHLSPKYGFTIKEIQAAKIKIYKKINLNINSEKKNDIINYISDYIKRFNPLFLKKKPKLILLLGDRYEILPIAICAYFHNIPILHFHGGEKTEGSLDDGVRNALSVFSTYHFVANTYYKKRLIAIKGDSKNIFNVGSLASNYDKKEILNKKKLSNLLNIKLKKFGCVTLYSEKNIEQNKEKIKIILKAIDNFKDIQFIFTLPTNDYGNELIREEIIRYCKSNSNSFYFKSLGLKKYLSLLKNAQFILGNSSSGVIEAPNLGTFTINIGNRQKGRLMSKSIYNTGYNSFKISSLIKNILKKNKKIKKNPYFNKNSLKLSLSYIKNIMN